ncbi:uncharacterized protein LOC124706656 isoform X1 [Lolium rigidum]|uniref:uncharacterized protein LOC124706656 isoform X1 n=1 Tax=Lolium rigidum TaxID=89674 RepID=UPI001F5DFBD0|nr:uncharacterized protein LOC124706656 isoform X1 [Lolium rigidum]XP_047094284.1 uncharacterized protein LOC124706656 isoform X1 [Lolium rigidum]
MCSAILEVPDSVQEPAVQHQLVFPPLLSLSHAFYSAVAVITLVVWPQDLCGTCSSRMLATGWSTPSYSQVPWLQCYFHVFSRQRVLRVVHISMTSTHVLGKHSSEVRTSVTCFKRRIHAFTFIPGSMKRRNTLQMEAICAHSPQERINGKLEAWLLVSKEYLNDISWRALLG